MTSLDHAPFTPFMSKRTAHPPGITPLKLSDWLHRDAAYDAQMAYRDHLAEAARDVVFQARPEAAGPAGELLDLVVKANGEYGDFSVANGVATRPDGVDVPLTGDHPLLTAGRLAQEDFCLLWRPPEADEHILIGAILIFPSRWSLAEKMGNPLRAIHQRVPNYDASLAPRVQRLFDALRAEQPLVRANWLIHTTPELHQPLTEAAKAARERERSDIFYLRVERQSLIRLPHSGAIVFGIKTCVTAISDLTDEQQEGLLTAMEETPDEVRVYHGGHAYHDAATAAIRATLA